MEKKKKKTWIILIVVLLISGCISVLYVKERAVHEVETSYGVVYKNGYAYGIDLSEDYYYIFQTSLKTMKSRMIKYPRVQKEYAVEIKDLAIDEVGNAYAYKGSISGEKQKQEIVLCDFKKGVLIKKWDISDIYSDNYWYMIHQENQVELAFTNYVEDGDTYKVIIKRFVLDRKKESFEELGTESSSADFAGIFPTRRGDIIYMDAFGSYFRQQKNGSVHKIFTNDGSQVGTQNIYLNIVEDTLHFRNLNTGKDYKVDIYREPHSVEICEDCTLIIDYETDLGKIAQPKYEENGVWTGYVRPDETRYVPFIYEKEKVILDTLVLSLSDCIQLGMKMGVCCLFIILGIFLIYWIIRKWNQGVFPIVARMVMLIVPLLIGGYLILENAVKNQLTSSMISTERERLYQLGMDRVERIHLDWFESLAKRDITPTVLNNLENILNYDYKQRSSAIIYDISGIKLEETENRSEQLFFYGKEGEFYNLTDSYTYNVPIGYECSNMADIAMRRVLREKQAVSTYYDIQSGRWLAVFIPIQNENGQVIGMVESRMNILDVTVKVTDLVNKINRYILYGIGALLIALLILVGTALWPLGGLRKSVIALMNGAYHFNLKVKGNSEISAISNAFNRMAVNISGHMEELEEFQNKYEAFVPARFFELLGKEDVRGVELGDTVEVDSVIMSLNTNDFIDIAPYVDSKEMFGFINHSLHTLVPQIENHHGVIERFSDGGVVAFFTEDVRNALDSAISALQRLRQEDMTFGGKKVLFGAGICQGNLKLGIIGEESRMSASTVSEYNNLAGFLQSKASEYGTGILITDKAAKKIPDFEQVYHYRTLGYIYIHVTENLEKIYDVYDGDSEMQIRLKKQTQEEFQMGLDFFLSEKFQKARSCFVEVLRINRQDLAAQRYFYLCDKYLQDETGESVLYIEAY